MSPLQILFIILAAATLGTALMVVTSRNLVHSALWLVATLFGIAIFYVLLNAGFLAVVQVVIYIGAIAILMIFAIMLTRKLMQEDAPRYHAGWAWAALIALAFFAGIAWVLHNWPPMDTLATQSIRQEETLRALGLALVSPNAYVIPFELASVLLLAALIGAIVVAWERK